MRDQMSVFISSVALDCWITCSTSVMNFSTGLELHFRVNFGPKCKMNFTSSATCVCRYISEVDNPVLINFQGR